MAARIVELCESLRDFLNGQFFTTSFTAVHENVWYEDLADSNSLQVVVIPQDSEIVESTRGAFLRRYRVNVVVQQRFTEATDDTTTNALLALMEEIEDSLYMVAQSGFGWDAYNESTGSRQFIDVDAAAGERVFRVVLQLSYVGE